MALDLGKQIGPLPLGAWVVVVGGGLGVAYYTTRTKAPADPTVDTSGDPGVGDGSVGGWTSTTPPASGTGSADPRAAVVDNDTWAVYVEGILIGRYNYDPLLVDSAVRKYISGIPLSVTEYTIIRQALTIMVPPNPLPSDGTTIPPTTIPTPPKTTPPPVKTPPKPPAKPPVKKPSARYYTVKHGDTLWGISKRYYGTGTKWPTIYAANRKGKKLPDGTVGKISNPNHIEPPWRLVIP